MKTALEIVKARVGLESLNPQKVADTLGLKVFQVTVRGTTVDVDGDVDLSNCNLKRLPYSFGVVTGSFWCDHNHLTSLEGAPQYVGGGFFCNNNLLATLEGAPQKVGGSFSCHNNRLTSLEGAPQEVGWSFFCNNNLLASLEDAPQKVGWSFSCKDNPGSKTFVKPRGVKGAFYK